MSLENEINRLKRAKSNIRASLKTKIGLDIPEETKLDEYAKCIDDVESTCPHINGDFYSIRTNNGTNYSSLFRDYNGNNFDFLSKWDTSKVTNMSYMFYYCNKLTSLDFLSKWDTSNVTDMNYMFGNCSSLTTLDLSGLDTSKVTNISYMFSFCSSLISLDLSGWNTSQVTTMYGIFYSCPKLISVNLSGWDTSKVTNMDSMFYYSSGIPLIHIFGELDLSNLTSGFYYSSYANPIRGCVNLETLYLKNIYKYCTMTNASKWSINLGETAVKDECLIYIINQLPDLINDKGLTTTTNIILTLPKTNLLTEEQVAVAINKGWQVANTTYNLASYNVVYNLENVTCEEKLIAKEGMPFKLTLFAEDNYYITSVVVTMGDKTITPTYNKDSDGYITSANINITSVTGDIIITAKAKEIIRYSSFVVGVANPSVNNKLYIAPLNSYSVKKILINGESQTVPTSTSAKSYVVEDGDKIQIIGEFNLENSTVSSISDFKLQSNITSTYSMFNRCIHMTKLDLSSIDTLQVTNMSYMFYNCISLTSLDLSSFDTRNVTTCTWMLYGVKSTCAILINPDTFINKSTGKTFTPSELGWYGTFTDLSIILPPTYPTDPENPFLPPA